MQGMYSMRSPAVKRLMKEAQELSQPTEQYFAQPLEDNLFEWHFTLRGPGDSEFEDGIYHGRIILPPDYPMKPPSIILLTPNGRFDINKKICLSISGHHPESWQPSWSIRTALLAIIGFMPTHGAGAIGSLDYPVEERKKLAKKSQDWKCPTCGNINNILKPVTEASQKTTQEAKELASQINFQGEKEKKDSESSTGQSSNTQQSNSQTPKATSQSPQANQPTSTQVPQGFPQYQFNRFPYPSPFMQFPGFPQNIQPGNTSNSVPRFPPPPPFIPAMFPPGFMTNTSQGVQNPGMCMDANWYQNLTNTGQPSRVSQSSSGPPVSSIGVSSSSPVSRFSSVSSTSGVSSSSPVASVSPVSSTPGVSSSSPVPSVSPVSSTSGMSSSSPVSRVSSVSSGTSVSTSTRTELATVTRTRSIRTEQTENIQSTDVNTASSGTVPSQGNDSVTEGPSGQNTNTVIQNTGNPSNDNSTSLRQRAPASGTYQNSSPAGTQRTVPTGGIGHSAELRDHSRRTGISFSTFLILLISLAIAILLIRRFFLSRNWKFHYGM